MKFDFRAGFEIAKVSDLGVIFGYAMVCKIDGEPHVDLQGDHIPEDAMLEASTEFMKNVGVGCVMHERSGDEVVVNGEMIYAFPLTQEIADSLGIQVQKTGLVVGYMPDSDEVVAKARSGEFKGFSIGGRVLEADEVEIE